MSKTQNENTSKLKTYQIFLLSCLLGTIMIFNSNHVNYNRNLAKLNKEKGELFDNIISKRKLSTQNYAEEICSRASDELNEYYRTGNSDKLDIDLNTGIECKDKDKSYFKALLSIVRTALDDTEENSNSVDPESNGGGVAPGGRRNLRNLGGVGEVDQNDIIDYLMGFLAMGVFLVFGLLSIFGWIFCCICCCCNCCCCCCCKKSSCKLPCFIFTYVFYALVVAISIFGLSQANKIFVGLADTECSLLKFFEQVLHGEVKPTLPRWAGIEGIQGMLTDINTTVTDLSVSSLGTLNNYMSTTLPDSRNTFNTTMQTIGNRFFDSTGYLSPYIQTFTGTSELNLIGDYIYDVVFKFGKYNADENKYTPGSFLDIWYREFSTVDEEAYGYLLRAHGGFSDILGDDGLNRVRNALGEGRDKLDELTGPFTDANDEIGKIFSDISESIDKYGKLSVNILFGALIVMNIALAVLMLLISMFSGKLCTSCCCCRCIFKFCTHILWNILALLMILTFIIGSLIALIGKFGGDMMGLVSYIMSIDNFNSTNPLIVDKLNEAKDYMYTCIHGNGDIASLIGLGNSLDSFNDINNVESDIESVRNNFTGTINSMPTYNSIKTLLEKQQNYEMETKMFSEGAVASAKPYFSNKELINDYINENVPTNGRKWDFENSNNYECTNTGIPEGVSFSPKSCNPKQSLYYTGGTNLNFKAYADIFDTIDGIIKYANKLTPESGKADNVMKVINDLSEAYRTYLNNYIEILDFFSNTIHDITSIIRHYSDSQNAFSFLNGKFIGINLKIILSYLHDSLGGDFYTVGICLCVVGCSLILSISSTIILIVIINIGLKEAQEQKTAMNNADTVISPYDVNNPGQNIPKAY